MIAVEDEHMIQAFPFEGADEPLTIGIGSWDTKRRLQLLDATAGGNCREALAVLAVAIVDDVLGRFAPGCGLT